MPGGSSLADVLLDRLQREAKGQDDWPELVLAALEGEQAVDALLSTAKPAGKSAPMPKVGEAGSKRTPKPAYLHSITVEGFRGIGKAATLDLVPGPGLTLVIGRNGSGKSSFAEALEQLLTGDTYRWAHRTKEWRADWRNLHHKKAIIRAEFALEGERAPCAVVARQLLERASPETAGLWPRAAALLARQALEMSVDQFWATRKIPLDSCPTLQQLICLREYVADADLAGHVHHAWNALSRACHDHPYELPPSAGELEVWLEVIETWMAASSTKAAQ